MSFALPIPPGKRRAVSRLGNRFAFCASDVEPGCTKTLCGGYYGGRIITLQGGRKLMYFDINSKDVAAKEKAAKEKTGT